MRLSLTSFLWVLCALFPVITSAQGRLDNYVRAETTWGDTLNPAHSLPETGFQAFYININNPKKVIASETVNRPAIRHGYRKFHAIEPDELGIYWVGKIHIPQDGLYQLTVNKSTSDGKMRVLLDRHIVFSEIDRETDSKVMRLNKGDYTLEAEYINGHHGLNVSVILQPLVKMVDQIDLRRRVNALKLPKETVVQVVSGNNRKRPDNSVKIQVPQPANPYILILSDDDGTHWDVRGNQPELILYSGFDKGNTVEADAGIPVWAWRGKIPYSIGRSGSYRCQCNAQGLYNCGDIRSLKDFMQQIKALTGFPLRGITGKYAAKRAKKQTEKQAQKPLGKRADKVVVVPDIVMNAQLLQEDQKFRQYYKQMKERCETTGGTQIENLMKQ